MEQNLLLDDLAEGMELIEATLLANVSGAEALANDCKSAASASDCKG